MVCDDHGWIDLTLKRRMADPHRPSRLTKRPLIFFFGKHERMF